jgi:autotransporter-associated beta strand protein
LEDSGALGDSGFIDFQGGTLRFSSNNTTDYSDRFASFLGNQTYRIDTNGQPVTFSNTLGSDGGTSLTKLGLGTLYLEADSSYGGNTTIKAGTLALTTGTNSTGAITGSPQITICTNAFFDVSGVGGYALGDYVSQTLRGTGTVIGDVTVTSNGTVSPGYNSTVGMLTINGKVDFSNGGTLEIRITNPGSPSTDPGGSSGTGGGVHNFLSVTGETTVDKLTGDALNLTSMRIVIDGTNQTFTSGQSYSYKIATFAGSDLSTLASDPSQFSANFSNVDDFAFSLTGDSSGNVYLNIVPVPEPAAVLGIAVGALAVGGFVRRRIRKPTA